MPAKIYYTEQQKQELIDLYQNQKVPISVIVASGKFPGSKDVIRRNLNNWGCDKLVEGSLVKDFQRDILEPWLYEKSTIYLDRKYLRYSLFKDSNYEIPFQNKEKIFAFGIEA